MPTMHDCVSQMGCGILPPLLKSYNAILDSQPIHGAPVQHFAFCLFSVPADPICGAPLMKEMETKYPDKWQEKRRAKPVCFVSRNQKRPGRHFHCFLETKHAKNPGLFPMFPFSCVSTSTLLLYCLLLDTRQSQEPLLDFLLSCLENSRECEVPH